MSSLPLTLAGCLPSCNNRTDTRVAAKALPASPETAHAVALVLHADADPVFSTISSHASRNFRLSLSAFLATFEVNFSALLAEQRDSPVSTALSSLFVLVTAGHFCVLHSRLMSEHWSLSGPRFDSFVNSLAGLLCTLAPAPELAHADSRSTLQASLAPCLSRVRSAVFLRRIQLAFPDHHELQHQFAGVHLARFSSDDHTIYFSDNVDPSAITEVWLVKARNAFDADITLSLAGSVAVSFSSAASLAPLRLPLERQSRFLPASIHWSEQAPSLTRSWCRDAPPPDWFARHLRSSPPPSRTCSVVRPIPDFHVTRVIAKRSQWFRRFKRHLGHAARVILDGRLTIPMDCHEGPPLDSPNLKSCFESPAHTAFVDSIVAEYLVTGVASWYPSHAKPLAICPLGVVPKRTHPFFRLVIDA